jgi:iron complex outermembrane receptor protein
MKVKRLYEKATGLCCLVAFAIGARAGEVADTVRLHEVVVGEHRSTVAETYLPQSVTVVGHDRLAAAHQPSTLPTLVDLVPGLFVPGRGMMGYGVNSGGAGALLVRGLSSGVGQMLVCIDGEPQFSGIYGHSVADFLQSHAVERVEVLRGPASARYGSNAMGGTLNFVTRQAAADRVATNVSLGAGSYATMQAEATNLVRKGRFSSTVTAQYNRSDNHRPNMDFRQAGALAKLGYRFSDHWRASAMADVNHFYAQLPGTTARPMTDNEQWITRGAANLTLHNDYAGTAHMPTQGGLTIYTNFGKHKIDDGTADPLNAPSTQYFRSRDNVAGLISNALDFVKAMGWQEEAMRKQLYAEGIERNLFPDLSPEEAAIVGQLRQANDLQLSMLSVKTAIPIGQLTALLFQLEMKGVVKPLAGGVYHLLM